MTYEELLLLPFEWLCIGGVGCATWIEDISPSKNCEQGCPRCVRIAIHPNGETTEYRARAH